MRSSKRISESHFLLACRARLAQRHVVQSGKKPAHEVSPGDTPGVGHCGSGRNAATGKIAITCLS